MPRLTIRTLMVLTAFVAVGLTGLWASTDIWGNGIFTAVLAILTGSIILAVYREGEGRAFWIGFALFGGVYLAASRSPVSTSLLPTLGLAWLPGVVAEARLNGRLYDRGHDTEKDLVTGTPANFHLIGHSLLAVIVGYLGGIFACRARRSRRC